MLHTEALVKDALSLKRRCIVIHTKQLKVLASSSCQIKFITVWHPDSSRKCISYLNTASVQIKKPMSQRVMGNATPRNLSSDFS